MNFACRRAHIWSISSAEGTGKDWDSAVEARVVVCLKRGMTLDHSNHFLFESFSHSGKTKILESAWFKVHRNLESFATFFEEYRVRGITRNLNTLRPAQRWKEKYHTYRMENAKYLFNSARDTALDSGYRKYFPEDEEEVEKILGYPLFGSPSDPMTDDGGIPMLKLNSVPHLHEIDLGENLESRMDTNSSGRFPAINSLTNAFWD
jgi:hypothetical protein